MSKPILLKYGRFYHIYSRGINRENVFIEERNYHFFMKRYAQYIEPVADTYAYCLLRNHFHVMLRTKTVAEQEAWFHQTFQVSETRKIFKPKPPSHQFGTLLNAYAKAINKAYGRTGSLFQHPFGRIEVTNERHLQNLLIYIHQNPQHHGMIDDFRDWPYSSYGALCSKKKTRIKRDDVLAWFNDIETFEAMHQTLLNAKILEPLELEDF